MKIKDLASIDGLSLEQQRFCEEAFDVLDGKREEISLDLLNVEVRKINIFHFLSLCSPEKFNKYSDLFIEKNSLDTYYEFLFERLYKSYNGSSVLNMIKGQPKNQDEEIILEFAKKLKKEHFTKKIMYGDVDQKMFCNLKTKSFFDLFEPHFMSRDSKFSEEFLTKLFTICTDKGFKYEELKPYLRQEQQLAILEKLFFHVPENNNKKTVKTL